MFDLKLNFTHVWEHKQIWAPCIFLLSSFLLFIFESWSITGSVTSSPISELCPDKRQRQKEYFTLKQQCPHLERWSMQGVNQKNRNPIQVQNDVCPYKHRTPQQHKNSKLLDHPHNFQFQSHVFKGKVLWPIFKRWLKWPHICTKPLDNRAVVKANYLNDAICPQPKSSKT